MYATSFRQEVQATTVRNKANFGKALCKFCFSSCINQIAGEHQVNACACSYAVNHANERFFNGGNAFCNVTYFSDESFFISYIVNGFEEGQVAARTKCFTITGQYYALYFCVSLHFVKCFVNAINQCVVHRVKAGRTIQSDGSNVVFYSIQYSVFH